MCGIFCCLTFQEDVINNELEVCERFLKRRGPDSFETISLRLNNTNILFAASVLWLQGAQTKTQPVVTANSIFVYNGDIFGGEEQLRKEQGDTILFLKKLETSKNVSETLSNIEGPYAFVYLNKNESKLYFGRDIYGRRSLLLGKNKNKLVLSSVAGERCDFIELPAIGTFSFCLRNKTFEIEPWQYQNKNFHLKLKEIQDFVQSPIEIKQILKIELPLSFTAPPEYFFQQFINIKNSNFQGGIESLLENEKWSERIHELRSLLGKAIRKRISNQPQYCQECIEEKNNCRHALVGVLFSGGLDCAILALLADEYCDKLRPIDLINVAFSKTTPDRQTGLETLEELRSLKPERQWNFVDVDVSEEKLNWERQNHIRYLIHPLRSVLDDSLGCALWFAARGKNDSYSSSTRVLLVGMGADELFGGYTRHRAALKQNGWTGLQQSLEEDWQNISHRNLGRDDRVVSDHGRQLRTPYLDENVVAFARSLPAWEKTWPAESLFRSAGEKILLRSLAYKLGLKRASSFKKRALQFGSRIANKKENAGDVSPRL